MPRYSIISATLGQLSDSTLLTLPHLVSHSITPAGEVVIYPDVQQLQYAAAMTFSDSHNEVITSITQWSSDEQGVVFPSTPGLAVIYPQVTVNVSPATKTMVTGTNFLFSASVAGVVDQTVTWSALTGTVNAVGGYTASFVSGADVITATSQADPLNRTGSATITVVEQDIQPAILTGDLDANTLSYYFGTGWAKYFSFIADGNDVWISVRLPEGPYLPDNFVSQQPDSWLGIYEDGNTFLIKSNDDYNDAFGFGSGYWSLIHFYGGDLNVGQKYVLEVAAYNGGQHSMPFSIQVYSTQNILMSHYDLLSIPRPAFLT